ncbi:PASTA domain-containing protein, partial [Frankia sp. Cpl3]|nr:PASTA domain-containing protein [Frankia sp. Cpl3]
LIGMGTSTAELRAKQEGFQVTIVGTGTKIVQQYPGAQEKVVPEGQVYLVTDQVKGAVMPDFKGKSLREVMEFASMV